MALTYTAAQARLDHFNLPIEETALKHKIFVVDVINCLSKGKVKTSSEVAL